MRLRKMFKNKLAFTLVELVIAIAVMAILAGVVTGSVLGARDSARRTAATTPASSLKTTLDTFYTQNYDSTTKAKALMDAIKGDFKDATVVYGTGSSKPTGDITCKIVLGNATAPTDDKVLSTYNGSSDANKLIIYVCAAFYYTKITCVFGGTDGGTFTMDKKPTAY